MELEKYKKIMDVICNRISGGKVEKQLFIDCISVASEIGKDDIKLSDSILTSVYNDLNKIETTNVNEMRLIVEMKKSILKYKAPRDFDSYLRYIEWDRETGKKFYPPRRKALRPVVQALQDLADDKYDILTISLPPGCGKSATAIFFLCWLAGREPDKSILGASHSASFMRGVYDECLRVLQKDGEYLWYDVFPFSPVVNTNAQNMLIDLRKAKRFTTLEFTSIGAGNAGKVRAEQLLYCDDLVDGIETALSIERLNKLYEQYRTDLTQRKIGNCKELHIATRWSVHDVIGRLQDQYEGNPRMKSIVVPALNENDESNFDYKNAAGFTTDFYHKQRELMDDLSWKALYMNEPIEREGLLYDDEELKRYYELPSDEPDAIIAVVDTKDRGDDYCVMPIAYQYGDKYYIEDCVCDNSLPEIFVPELVNKLYKHKVKLCQFESNSAGGVISDNVREKLKNKGGITHITKKYTTSNKETKIIVNSAYVKEHFYFKDKTCYTQKSEYGKFMRFLCGYTLSGKNKHDDVPDAMAMLADFVQNMYISNATVVKRMF